MQAFRCPNCGAPLDAPPEGQRVLHCPFCKRTIELDAMPPAAIAPPAPQTARWIFAGAGVGIVVVTAAVVLLGQRPSAPPAVTESTPVATTASPAPIPSPIASAPPVVADASAHAAPDVVDGPVTILWKGRLVSSTGAAPPAGAPCTITASVTSRGGEAEQQRLTLQCQGQMLYDSDVPLEGMSNSMFSLDEEPVAGEALAFRYALGAEDTGPRSPPRAQILLDTPRGTLDAFRDTSSPFRVHATVDHVSAVRRGKAVLADTVPPFDGVVARTARVASKTGVAPFATPTCSLRISPGHATKDTCRVLLECGGRVVYGAGDQGYDECVIAGRQPKSFVDPSPTPSDGDPELSCDLEAGTATLGDTSKSGATYSVVFALSE